jgi:CheY-like chemotaxis protein
MKDASCADDSLRVLIVDDNLIYHQLVTRLLKKKLGICHITNCMNVEQAIAQLNDRPFDLILMDIDMPLITGVMATQQIRDPSNSWNILESNRTIPIIALTTNSLEEDYKLYMKVGMNGMIPKPVVEKTLRTTLQECLPITRRHSLTI